MKLVRSGGIVLPNGRSGDIAAAMRVVLRPILGDVLAKEVAGNAAQTHDFNTEEDQSYEPDNTPLSEIVRSMLLLRLRAPKTYRAEHLTGDMIDDAVAAVAAMALVDAQGPLKPNRRASTLNGRPSMDTSHVGREIDPDRYKGKRGTDLDAAMDRYETFHAKRPLRTVELRHDLPTSVVPVGQVISTMYRTDKWHEDGDDEDYKHVHDNSRGGKEREYDFGKGVIAYEPTHQAKRSRVENRPSKNFAGPTPAVRLPVHAPKALSLLGYCLGVFVQRFDDNEVYEISPRGSYLFCSPKGDMLALYSPDEQPDGSDGFLMIMAGGGLRVLKGGIDG